MAMLIITAKDALGGPVIGLAPGPCELFLGSGFTVDVRLEDDRVPEEAVSLLYGEEGWVIKALAEGIAVEGTRLPPGQTRALHVGDEISLAGVTLFVADPSALTNPTLTVRGESPKQRFTRDRPVIRFKRQASPAGAPVPSDWGNFEGLASVKSPRPARPSRGVPLGIPLGSNAFGISKQSVEAVDSETLSLETPEPLSSKQVVTADVGERVQMTAFGPEKIRRGAPLILQTILHSSSMGDAALELARIVEKDPHVAQRLPLTNRLHGGERVRVKVMADRRVRIDESEQSVVWLPGELRALQFVVRLPLLDWRWDYVLTIDVSVDELPVGRCKLKLTVSPWRTEPDRKRECGALRRYDYVFVSYATEDAPVVAQLAQVFEVQGIPYFLDKVSLRAGCEWNSELEANIRRSELFLLCWSRNAARSDWVRREIDWALRVRSETSGKRPEIRPVVLCGPPVPEPPPALRHLHFGSPLLTLMNADQSA